MGDDRLATIYDGMQSVGNMQSNRVEDSQREASNMARLAHLQPRNAYSDSSQEIRVESQGGVVAGQGLHQLIPAGADQKGKSQAALLRDDSVAALDRGTAATAGSGALRDLSARG